MKQTKRGLIHAAFLTIGGGLLTALLGISDALAATPDMTKTVTCQKNAPAGTQYTSSAVKLERFSVPAEWGDPGSHYEIGTHVSWAVYADKPQGTPLCSAFTNWGTREYRLYNAWSGDRWTYPLDLTLVVHNVPADGVLSVNAYMVEHDFPDIAAADYLDLNRYRGYTGLDLNIYPAKKIGYFLPPSKVETNDPKHLIEFGRSKRFVGDGIGYKSGEVIASLDLTIDTTAPSPVGGIAEKVETPKVVGAVSCERYAQTAVGLDATAKARGCGFGPPEWSDDYQMHLDWCRHGDNAALASEANAWREERLAKDCKPKATPPSNEPVCREYALKAVALNERALKLQCGFRPPVWSNKHQMHFDWCMRGNNASRAPNENAKRQQAIADCQAGSANKPGAQSAAAFCNSYALEAIGQFHDAKKRGCGFFGPEWSPDINWHNNWCVQMYNSGQQQAVTAGTAKRTQMLAQCK